MAWKGRPRRNRASQGSKTATTIMEAIYRSGGIGKAAMALHCRHRRADQPTRRPLLEIILLPLVTDRGTPGRPTPRMQAVSRPAVPSRPR